MEAPPRAPDRRTGFPTCPPLEGAKILEGASFFLKASLKAPIYRSYVSADAGTGCANSSLKAPRRQNYFHFVRHYSFPGSAWERTAPEAPPRFGALRPRPSSGQGAKQRAKRPGGQTVGPLFGPHVGPHLLPRFPRQFRCFSHQGAKGPNFFQKGVAPLRTKTASNVRSNSSNASAPQLSHVRRVKSQIRNPFPLSPPFSKTVNLSFPDRSARIAATPCRPTRRIFLACKHLSPQPAFAQKRCLELYGLCKRRGEPQCAKFQTPFWDKAPRRRLRRRAAHDRKNFLACMPSRLLSRCKPATEPRDGRCPVHRPPQGRGSLPECWNCQQLTGVRDRLGQDAQRVDV